MDLLCKVVFVTCVVALSTHTAAEQRCNGGVECINLDYCKGLYTQLENFPTPELRQLLKSLHCGFDGNQPKFDNTGFDLWNSILPFQQVTKKPKTRKNRKRKKSTTKRNDLSYTTEMPIRVEVTTATRFSMRQIVQQKPIAETISTADSKEICCPPEFQSTNFYPTTSTTAPDSRNGASGGWNNNNAGSQPWGGGSSQTNGFDNSRGGSNNGNSQNGEFSGGSVDPINLLPDRKMCGIQNDDRIVGGTRTELDEHPWMVLLRYDKPNGWGFYCGGVLISSRYVLTAAHCVKGQDLPTSWSLSQVRLGEWNTSTSRDCMLGDCADPVQNIEVEERIAHENYDPQDPHQHNDIALLRLAQPAQISDFVKPICLPLTKDLKNNFFDGHVMEVAGWGKTESRSESDVKLKVKVSVVGKSECAQVFNRVGREINNKQICAGGSAGKDSCRGDSGGALMGTIPSATNWFALGVVSYGPSPCGTPGWPGVYTRIGAYVDWILSKIRP